MHRSDPLVRGGRMRRLIWLSACLVTAGGQAAAVAGRPCASAAFGQDGSSLVTVSGEGVVRRQTVPDGKLLAERALRLPGWARVTGSSAPGAGGGKSPFLWLALS